jgi:hypothetical protein
MVTGIFREREYLELSGIFQEEYSYRERKHKDAIYRIKEHLRKQQSAVTISQRIKNIIFKSQRLSFDRIHLRKKLVARKHSTS